MLIVMRRAMITEFQNSNRQRLLNLLSMNRAGMLARTRQPIVTAVPRLGETPAFLKIVDE
jgi:hypothetical protein